MCTSTATLLAEATYQVTVGETFRATVTLAGALDGQAQLRTTPGGGLVGAFTVAVGATAVDFTYDTAGLSPGVYYFDLFVQKADGDWYADVSRGGLVVVQNTTVLS